MFRLHEIQPSLHHFTSLNSNSCLVLLLHCFYLVMHGFVDTNPLQPQSYTVILLAFYLLLVFMFWQHLAGLLGKGCDILSLPLFSYFVWSQCFPWSESPFASLILYLCLRCSLQHLPCLLWTSFMSLTLNLRFSLLSSSLRGVCQAALWIKVKVALLSLVVCLVSTSSSAGRWGWW